MCYLRVCVFSATSTSHSPPLPFVVWKWGDWVCLCICGSQRSIFTAASREPSALYCVLNFLLFYVFCLHIFLSIKCVPSAKDGQKVLSSPGTRIVHGFELLYRCYEANPGNPEELTGLDGSLS